jgi:hypothetical protein
VIYAFIADHMKRNLSPCAPAYGPVCLPFSYVGFGPGEVPEVRVPDVSLFDFNRRFWEAFFAGKAARPRQLLMAAEADFVRLARTPKGDPDTPEHRAQSLEMLLGRMQAEASGAGARLLVLHIPYLERDSTGDVPPPLRLALSRLKDRPVFLDLTPAVRRYYADPDRPLLRFERDSHPSALAHDLIASEVEKVIRERGLLDPVDRAASPADRPRS